MSWTGAVSETPEKLRMTPHRRSLHQDKSGELVLSYYPAGHVMDEHAHDVDQSSMITLTSSNFCSSMPSVVNEKNFCPALLGLRKDVSPSVGKKSELRLQL